MKTNKKISIGLIVLITAILFTLIYKSTQIRYIEKNRISCLTAIVSYFSVNSLMSVTQKSKVPDSLFIIPFFAKKDDQFMTTSSKSPKKDSITILYNKDYYKPSNAWIVIARDIESDVVLLKGGEYGITEKISKIDKYLEQSDNVICYIYKISN
jgi:hypothetical protein